jgi:hypothetical protein
MIICDNPLEYLALAHLFLTTKYTKSTKIFSAFGEFSCFFFITGHRYNHVYPVKIFY